MIGFTLDDLGIDPESGFKKPRARSTVRDDREQYDFTLHRLALGSWREVRDFFRSEARARSNGDLPLWFLLHWERSSSKRRLPSRSG